MVVGLCLRSDTLIRQPEIKIIYRVEKEIKKFYDVFPYMNIHYFHFIKQTLSLQLKAHFTAISFQKTVGLHLFIRIIDFLNGF